MDVRVLQLKKVILPQTEKLTAILKSDKSAYVSFQDYHLIDIIDVPNVGDQDFPWQEAYSCISAHRNQPSSKSKESALSERVCICHNLLLYNDDENSAQFWELPSKVLFVSMIQLKNDVEKLDLLREIKSALQKHGIEGNWCLYYAMDFCDAVLFVKNTSLKEAREALWSLTSNSNERIIRDISTQLTISRETVQAAFAEFEKIGKEVFKSDNKQRQNTDGMFDVELKANLQTYTDLNKFFKQLLSVFEDNLSAHRIFGHYDISAHFKNCTLLQYLYIAYLLNKMVSSDAANTIGIYSLLPQVEDMGNAENAKKIDEDKSLFDIVKGYFFDKARMLHVYEYDGFDANFGDGGYAEEVCQALLSLLKVGFTEEFALSMIEPLAGYLNISLNCLSDMRGLLCDGSMTEGEKRSALEFFSAEMNAFYRAFSQGISLLSQSVMHNDGEFVYSPSYQTRLFDVPPKLLALYEVAAHKIVKLLKEGDGEETDRNYYFLFNPDKKSRIFVDIISPDNEKNAIGNLSIIHMKEEELYNPYVAMALLCHEIAHQVGSAKRKRMERFEHICKCIAYYYCGWAFKTQGDEAALCELFAKSMGEAFAEEYASSNSTQKYYLRYVEQFARSSAFYMEELGNKPVGSLRDTILKKWNTTITKLDAKQKKLLKRKIEQWFSCDVMESDAMFESQNLAAEILLLHINRAIAVDLLLNGDAKKRLVDKAEAIIDAFSEAYSDLRMIELMNISLEAYKRFAESLPKTRSNALRKNAIYLYYEHTCDNNNEGNEKKEGDKEIGDDEGIFAAEQIEDYLQLCRENDVDLLSKQKSMSEIELKKKNAKDLFDKLKREMASYRSNIIGEIKCHPRMPW